MNPQPEKLAQLFLEGKEKQALKYLQELCNDDNKLSLYEDMITPAMYHIGELWELNKISVADEHLATGICDMVISQMENFYFRDKTTLPDEKKVMLLGVEEEQHYLGLKMAASVFKDQGWTVRYLGPNLPLHHALQFINEWKPEVIGVSAALSYRLPKLKEFLQAFQEVDFEPVIIIGGRMTKKHDLDSYSEKKVIVLEDLRSLQYWLDNGREGDMNATS
ncbi:B12-binding domain-containing protein [Thalassobacillus sp. C254]|uniref:cobalamin B12-binding domain-containing protein n=1 Tax=Thalassobacillus sp. C254 TaxID=1225341 RepID=UPI0006D24C4D|nr:cobalamin B12-binding domain-containing protein [Thalassobacillus sp. C254]